MNRLVYSCNIFITKKYWKSPVTPDFQVWPDFFTPCGLTSFHTFHAEHMELL